MVIHHLKNLLLAAALIAGTTAVYVPAAFAQSQSINGTIRGRVSDPSGASVAGATVTVTNPALGFSRTATTSSDGYYTLINLPLGTYKVNITAPGFAVLNVQNVTLNAGTEAQINGALTLGGTSTEVTVEAAATGIDPTNLNVQRTLLPREIENVPLTSRNPYNFIIFQPGMSGHPNPELGIPRTLNTNGLMDRINYQLDGMVNTEADRIGLRLFPIGNVFVKEVQTVSNSFAPEYGWTTGDVYNVISNSGTNQFHGMYQFIKRWVDATAYPLLQNKATSPNKPNLILEDHSFNLGGPVLKDRLFFFGSYEHVLRGTPAPVNISQANAAAIGLSSSELDPAPGTLHGTFMDARLDFTINKKNQIFARYNYFKNTFPFNTQVGGLNARSAGVDFADRAHVGGIQWISTITDHLLNELRVSSPFRSNSHFAGPATGPGPAIVINGVASFGGTSSAGDQYNDKQPSGSDNVSYVRGAHTFKAGFVISQLENKQRLVSFNRYTFASLNDYLAAKNGTNTKSYSNFSSQTDTVGVNYASLFYGFYAQDTWQLTPKLVAVYGLRYDRFISPKANPNAPFADSRKFNSPSMNWAPRLGFSYRAAQNTVLKISGGMFYQQTPTNLWFNALNQDGSNRTSTYTYLPSQAGAPSFPNIPSTAGAAAVQSVTTVNPEIKNEYTWNVNAQVSQQLTPRDSFTIGYILSNGRNLEYMHNINYINPIGTLADGRPVFSTANCAASSTPAPGCPSDGRATRLDNRFNAINRVESGANSSFNALFVNYTMALRHGMQINANYTWSHAITDAPEVNTFEQNLGLSNTLNRKFDRGNSSVNRPSAFNMTAVLEPTNNFQNRFAHEIAAHNMLALLFNISSGDQGNILASNQTVNGDPSTSGVGRPAFVGRNTVRSPNIAQIDARYTRSFPRIWDRVELAFLLEANNLMNHNNVTGIAITQPIASDGTASGSPLPPSRTTVLEQRIVQWGVKASF
ncbi:MAG: TonB-dependent receptor [Acidobacteria bacterium]|nr:TonB-dependent receptor [Acidobacteriota bacterium]